MRPDQQMRKSGLCIAFEPMCRVLEREAFVFPGAPEPNQEETEPKTGEMLSQLSQHDVPKSIKAVRQLFADESLGGMCPLRLHLIPMIAAYRLAWLSLLSNYHVISPWQCISACLLWSALPHQTLKSAFWLHEGEGMCVLLEPNPSISSVQWHFHAHGPVLQTGHVQLL